jgi:hypothetical protein
MSKPVKWKIKIEHLMTCNCHWGCPCSFDSPPTHGTCEAALAYRIVEGKYGDVSLAGLRWVLAAIWPGPLHEGKGRGVVYLDARAKGAGRDALEAIATGRAGGPIGIFMSTVTEGVVVNAAHIDFKYAGQNSYFRAEAAVDVAFEPIRNPVTGKEHHASVLLPTGLLAKREDHFSAKIFIVKADGLAFQYPGRNALAFTNVWRGP